jgi:competence protein ComEC
VLLPLWVTAFATGIAVAVIGGRPVALAVAGAAALVALWRAARRGPALAITAAALAIGVVGGVRALPVTAAEDERQGRVLAGVTRGPDVLDAKKGRSRLWLTLRSIDGRPAGGTVALSAATDGVGDVQPGDVVSFETTLRRPVGLANPGLPDARMAAAGQGIDFYAGLSPRERLRREATGPPWSPRRLAWRLRRALDERIAGRVAGPSRQLLRTVVLGERADVDPHIEDGFRAAGATHVLSVSGLHLAAVAGLVFLAVRRLVGRWPALALRVPAGRVAALAALPAVILYTLLTGEAVATLRSAVMAGVVLGAGLFGRPFSLASSIAAAALVLLADRPLLLLDVSFQLTFASVIALAVFAGPLAGSAASPSPAPSPSWRDRALGWLRRFAAATAAASVVTAPLVAHHFGEVTPAAPLGNLALVPLIELGLLPLALGGATLALVHPVLGVVPLTLAGWAGQVALGAAELFRRWAPVILVPAPTPVETAVLVAGGAALLAAAGRMAGRRRPWAIASAVCLVLAGGSLGGRALARRMSDEVRVTFLDVGQGDAAVIEGPRGFVAVVDGGGAYDDSFDTGARVLEPYLRARGIGAVDLVVLSHPHPDHLNGLFRVLQRFAVGALWTSGDDGRNPRYRALCTLAAERRIRAPPPAPLERTGLTLTPLGPWLDDRIAAPPGLSVNDASLVFRLAYRGRSVLFPGDLEADGEGELVGRAGLGLAVASDVLKVPHHGSRTSSGDELLGAVRPGLAVMSLGRNNRFGFPHAEVLARYAAHGIRVLRTDLSGAVTLVIDADGGLHATCVRGCR